MNRYIYPLLFIFSLVNIHQGLANCPGCVVDVPGGLAEDTLFLGMVPDGIVNAYYDEDISFRMPKTTTPVSQTDPDVPGGLNIVDITIVGISNLPPGLAWETDATSYDPQEQTDGCIKFCGTPLVSGLFVLEVQVQATIFIGPQDVSFPMEIYIEPATSTNDGFSLTNNSGCGAVSASFENNIPSNGIDGYSYNWDFGNGNVSLDENPSDQSYDQPGTYIVNYQAVIDTSGYILTRIGVNEVSCFDIPTFPDFSNKPDLQIEIVDPSGVRIYESATIDNVDPPIDYFPNLFIGPGVYQLKVIDEDSGINGGDDTCAEITFNLLSDGTFTSSDYELELDIFHPVDTITTSDTITVYAIPDAPVVTNSGALETCAGDDLVLISSYTEGNQWFFNGEELIGATANDFEVLESGTYQVMYTSTDGCTAMSEEVLIEIYDLPVTPEFENTNNLLSLLTNITYDAGLTFQWYQDGNLLEGETSAEYCSMETGMYTLEVTDPVTGCTSEFVQDIEYDGSLNCFTNTEDFSAVVTIDLYPNPVVDWLTISLDISEGNEVNIQLYDLLGRPQGKLMEYQVNGPTQLEPIDVTSLAAGIYVVEFRIGAERVLRKFVKH